MHELWSTCRNRIHFLLLLAPTASVIHYTGEHHIGSVLIRELVLYCADWPDGRLLGRLWRRPSPLAILVSQWHFLVVWFDGFAPLWNLQGASRVCS